MQGKTGILNKAAIVTMMTSQHQTTNESSKILMLAKAASWSLANQLKNKKVQDIISNRHKTCQFCSHLQPHTHSQTLGAIVRGGKQGNAKP